MPKRTLDHHAWLIGELKDPVVACNYLTEARKDSVKMFLKALRNVAEAHGMTGVATRAGIRRESLYRALSKRGNPRLTTLSAVLGVLGLRTVFQPESPSAGVAPADGAVRTLRYRYKPRETSGLHPVNVVGGNIGSGIWNVPASGLGKERVQEALFLTNMMQPAIQSGLGGAPTVYEPYLSFGTITGEQSHVQTEVIKYDERLNILSDMNQERRGDLGSLAVAEYTKQLTAIQNLASNLAQGNTREAL